MIANVVAGILTRNGKFLVEKRRDNDDADPGYVEIPGWHVREGESLESALRREMKEELGIRVEKMKAVSTSLATATNGEKQRIHYFHVGRWNGIIRAKEAEKVYWESQVSGLSMAPDRAAIESLLKPKALQSQQLT